MSGNFIHIGLHKTSSTTLQYLIWPEVAKNKNYKYFNYESLDLLNITKSVIKKEKEIKDLQTFNIKNSIISWEGLSTWDMKPFFFNDLFEINKKIFNKNDSIILFLRNPKDLFTSIYIEKVMEFFLIDPNVFFLTDNEFSNLKRKKENDKMIFTEQSNIILRNKYCPQIFSYKKIISLYKSFFKKVYVIKYEDCKNFNFCKKIFNLDKDFNEMLKNKFSNHIGNKSFSKQSVNFSIKLGKFLKFIGLNHNKLKKFKYKHIYYRPKNRFQKFWNKIFLQSTNWAHLIRYHVDRKIKYKKYEINFDNLGISLKRLNKEYQEIDFDF